MMDATRVSLRPDTRVTDKAACDIRFLSEKRGKKLGGTCRDVESAADKPLLDLRIAKRSCNFAVQACDDLLGCSSRCKEPEPGFRLKARNSLARGCKVWKLRDPLARENRDGLEFSRSHVLLPQRKRAEHDVHVPSHDVARQWSTPLVLHRRHSYTSHLAE